VKDKKDQEWIAKRLGMTKSDVEKACIAILGMSTEEALKGKSYEADCVEWLPEIREPHTMEDS